MASRDPPVASRGLPWPPVEHGMDDIYSSSVSNTTLGAKFQCRCVSRTGRAHQGRPMNINKYLYKDMDKGISGDINVRAIVFEGFARWRCERENIRIMSNSLSKVSSIIVENHCRIDVRQKRYDNNGQYGAFCRKACFHYKSIFCTENCLNPRLALPLVY